MIVRTFAIYCDTCRNQPDWTRTHSATVKRHAKADGWTITHEYHKCPACNGKDPHYWQGVAQATPTTDDIKAMRQLLTNADWYDYDLLEEVRGIEVALLWVLTGNKAVALDKAENWARLGNNDCDDCQDDAPPTDNEWMNAIR